MTLTHASQSAFDAWMTGLRRICGHFDSRPPAHHVPFHGEIGSRKTCGFELAEIRTNACSIARRQRDAQLGDDRYCFLIVQRRGQAGISQNGWSLELMPGEMALVDSARAFEILPRGLIEHASLHLPRDKVAARMPGRQLPFGKVGTRGSSGQLLQLMINRIVSRELDGDDANAQGEEISEALSALLIPLTLDPGRERMTEAAPDLLYQGACQLIDQQLQEPGLTPASLAERLNISLRQLYRLFEAHDDTVCRFIQRSRLQRSAEELASPGQVHLSITEIAYRWGFSDSAHFSRVFKKAYGESPRDYRHRRCLH